MYNIRIDIWSQIKTKVAIFPGLRHSSLFTRACRALCIQIKTSINLALKVIVNAT